MSKQKYTSANTDLKQIPAVYKIMRKHLSNPAWYFATNRECLDYGGGAGNKLTDAFAQIGVRNFVLDPFNRSEDHNALVRRLLTLQPASFAFCANVLNVIKEPELRMKALYEIAALTSREGKVYISVHEGNKTSRGKRTRSDSWQANRPLKSYVREIKKVFGEGFYLPGRKVLVCEGRRATKRKSA